MKLLVLVLISAAAFLVLTAHYDIDGFCPMALGSIEMDHGRPGYEKAEAEWQNFADYYHCDRPVSGKDQ